MAIDMKQATDMLIESVQQKYYGDIKAKLKNKTKHNHPPIIHQLGLYLDDNNLIRCKGRLQYSELSHNVKLLNYTDYKSDTSDCLHGGVRETLTHAATTISLDPQRQTACKNRTQEVRNVQKSRRTTISHSGISSIARNQSQQIPALPSHWSRLCWPGRVS